jgi:hypothetical protein
MMWMLDYHSMRRGGARSGCCSSWQIHLEIVGRRVTMGGEQVEQVDVGP